MSDVIQFPEHDPTDTPIETLVVAAPAGEATAGLVVIGVPSGYAALEAHRAIGAGADVMLVSDGISIDDEVVLKRRAHDAGHLLMGPGCETAIIDGIGIGFANAVSAGRVGVIATSGTSAQEATVLLDRFGVGVSTCLVTGRRDLTDKVGAATALDSLARLATDTATEVILLVADAWSPEVARRLLPALAATGKPGSVCLMGADGVASPDGVEVHPAIDGAALGAARLAGARPVIPATEPTGWVSAGHVRGIFSGPGLCAEASAILAGRLGRVVSNAPAGDAVPLEGDEVVRGHACLDVATAAREHGGAAFDARCGRFARNPRDRHPVDGHRRSDGDTGPFERERPELNLVSTRRERLHQAPRMHCTPPRHCGVGDEPDPHRPGRTSAAASRAACPLVGASRTPSASNFAS